MYILERTFPDDKCPMNIYFLMKNTYPSGKNIDFSERRVLKY